MYILYLYVSSVLVYCKIFWGFGFTKVNSTV